MIIGVDVGGTYTDLFAFNPKDGSFKVGKVPSQRGSEAEGFQNGLSLFGEIADIDAIIHGTTVGTNALLERKGAKIGLITTKGFRDVLEMRRRDRAQTWGLSGDYTPIVPRDMRLEVDERVLADGTVHTPLDEISMQKAVKKLVKLKAEAIAIVFINAYANKINEQKAFEIAQKIAQHMPISVSNRILPEIREFERTSTTAINAYLQPVVGSYLARLDTALKSNRFKGQFHIIQSNGGVMSTKAARDYPMKTALSGPAAGVIAAQKIAQAAGFDNVITGDLGGTSFDVALISKGKTNLSPQTTLDFGVVIRNPMIEITTIGAGGGSIASVDKSGFLSVGPHSAGSIPGPACYGIGTLPTLTDANLILGRINADNPIGGRAKFNFEAAQLAIETHIARPLNISITKAAAGIVMIADNKMAGALRLVSIERGHDPKDFALMPFGGGGALHVSSLIDMIGLKAALVPRFPGVTSALGCVMADVRHDQVKTIARPLNTLDLQNFNALVESESKAAISIINAAGLPLTGIDVITTLDMHYIGQTHTIPVIFKQGDDLNNAFDKAYLAIYGRVLEGIPKNIINLRVAAIGKRPEFDLNVFAPMGHMTQAVTSRKIWFDDWVETPVYQRLNLPTGAIIKGPALLEQPDATILIAPNKQGVTDNFGNMVITTC